MPLHPSLESELHAAYARNVEAGLVRPETVSSLGDLAAGVVAAFDASSAGKERAALSRSLEAITNPETKKHFEAIFNTTQTVFDRINLTVPTPEDCVAAGTSIDFVHLADIFEVMQADGLEPQLVLTPANLAKDQAVTLFDHMTANVDGSIPRNPLKAQDDGNGLWINDRLTPDLWNELNTPDASTPTMTTTGSNGTTTLWTLQILPTADTDEAVEHRNTSYTNLPEDSKHALPPINSFITSQAVRIQQGIPPHSNWSNYASTWLNNSQNSSEPLRAPNGDWRAAHG